MAIVEYAEWYNTQNDYCLMNDETTEIIIEDPEGVKQSWDISAEKSITYDAALKN